MAASSNFLRMGETGQSRLSVPAALDATEQGTLGYGVADVDGPNRPRDEHRGHSEHAPHHRVLEEPRVEKRVEEQDEEAGGKTEKKTFDRVIMAVGIVGNIENIGLENTKVQVDEKGFVKLLSYTPATKEWAAVRYPLEAAPEGAPASP